MIDTQNDKLQKSQHNGSISPQEKNKNNWQKKLMPWLITMPTLLIFLFVFLATQQMRKFNTMLEIETTSVLDDVVLNTEKNPTLINSLDYLRWVTLVKMEERSLDRRYKQGGALLGARIFTKYLGFFTGMILAIVGAIFIIAKLQEQKTEIEGDAGNGIKGKLSSSSPGVIFGVLGTVLMLSTILQHNEISVSDQPLFLNSTNLYLNGAVNPSTVNALNHELINTEAPKNQESLQTLVDSIANHTKF